MEVLDSSADLLLPVGQRLIAEKPDPLSVCWIGDGHISVERVGGVVCIEARQIGGISEATVCMIY